MKYIAFTSLLLRIVHVHTHSDYRHDFQNIVLVAFLFWVEILRSEMITIYPVRPNHQSTADNSRELVFESSTGLVRPEQT